MITLLALSSLTVAVVSGGAWLLGWASQPMLFSAGVNLAACWVSFFPISAVSKRRSDYLPQAVLGAMVIRITLVGAATIGAMAFGTWPTVSLSVWMVVFYLSLLAIETSVSVRMLHASSKAPRGMETR